MLNTYWFDLTDNEFLQLEKLADIFHEKNTHINLSAIRDLPGIHEKHIVDSLFFAGVRELFPEESWKRYTILDIGTGGGFPWLPIAITQSDTDVTLLDTRKKKITCIDEFITQLWLTNATWSWGRAEEIKYDAQFDGVVSRATAYMPTMLKWSKSHLKKWGYCIMYKQFDEWEDEDGRRESWQVGFTFIDTFQYELAGQERVIYVFQKR